MSEKVEIQLSVVPEPDHGTASVLIKSPNYAAANPFAAIRGNGKTDYLCGACRVPIAIGVTQGEIGNLVLKCGNCESYNVVRGTKL